MQELELIISEAMTAMLGVGLVGGLPLAIGMTTYAKSYNDRKQYEFLEHEFGTDNLNYVDVGEPLADLKRNGVISTPVKFFGTRYLLESEFKPLTWLADKFPDTRLYEPVRLVKQYGVADVFDPF